MNQEIVQDEALSSVTYNQVEIEEAIKEEQQVINEVEAQEPVVEVFKEYDDKNITSAKIPEIQEFNDSSHWLEEAQKLFDKANAGKLAQLHRAVIEDAHTHYFKVISKLHEVAGIDTASLILRDHQYHSMLKQFVKEHNVLCEAIKFLAENFPSPVVIQEGSPRMDKNKNLIKDYIAVGEGDIPYQTKHYVAALIYIAANIDKIKHGYEFMKEANTKLTENLARSMEAQEQLLEEIASYRTKALTYKQELDKHFPIINGLESKIHLYSEKDSLWIALSKNCENIQSPTISDFVKVRDSQRAYDFKSLENARNIQTKIANRKALSKVKEIEDYIIVKSVYQNLGQ